MGGGGGVMPEGARASVPCIDRAGSRARLMPARGRFWLQSHRGVTLTTLELSRLTVLAMTAPQPSSNAFFITA